MARKREEGSIESRAKNLQSGEYTSPGREVLNSALSLVAVIAITLVGGVVLKRVVANTTGGSEV